MGNTDEWKAFYGRRDFLKGMGIAGAGFVVGTVFPKNVLGQSKAISLVTGPVGTVFYTIGGGLANALSRHVPNLKIATEVTQGSVDNCMLIHQGKAELGLAFADITQDAYMGLGRFKSMGKASIRALLGIYNNYLHTVATVESGIKTFADLKGKRVSTSAPGAGSEIITLRILEAHGLNPDKDIRRERLNAGEAAGAMKDRKIDAFFHVSGIPMPIVMDLVFTPGVHIRLLSHEKGIAKMQEKFGPLYLALTIPKGTYKGVDYDVPVVGNSNLLICNEKMDDALAYSVVKAILENKQEVALVHKEAEKISLQTAPLGSPIPFHPGAIKYFQEKGVKVPAN
jgi:uncharacterized protein